MEKAVLSTNNITGEMLGSFPSKTDDLTYYHMVTSRPRPQSVLARHNKAKSRARTAGFSRPTSANCTRPASFIRSSRQMHLQTIPIRPPIPADSSHANVGRHRSKVEGTRLNTRSRHSRPKKGETGTHKRRLILAERMVLAEKQHLVLNQEQTQSKHGFSDLQTPLGYIEDVDQSNVAERPRSPTPSRFGNAFEDITQNNDNRPRSPTPSRFFNDSDELGFADIEAKLCGQTITTQLLQLQLDEMKRKGLVQEQSVRHKRWMNAHKGGVPVPQYFLRGRPSPRLNRAPPSNSVKFIVDNIPKKACNLQKEKVPNVVGMNGWNVKKDSPVGIREGENIQDLLRLDKQTVNEISTSPRSIITKNRGSVGGGFKAMESFHFGPRYPQMHVKKAEKKPGRRPQTAKPLRRRNVKNNKRRPHSAGPTRMSERNRPSAAPSKTVRTHEQVAQRFVHAKKVYAQGDRELYSPRYRHVVYTIPVSKAQKKETIARIAALGQVPEPGKPREFRCNDLRVSRDGDIYRAKKQAKNPKTITAQKKTWLDEEHNPHGDSNPRKPHVSRIPYLNPPLPDKVPIKLFVENSRGRGTSVSQQNFDNYIHSQATGKFAHRGALKKKAKKQRPKSAGAADIYLHARTHNRTTGRRLLDMGQNADTNAPSYVTEGLPVNASVNEGDLCEQSLGSQVLRDQAYEEYKTAYTLSAAQSPKIIFDHLSFEEQ